MPGGSALFGAKLIANLLVTQASDPIPEGFEDLAEQRLLVVDVYYGGRKVSETEVEIRFGELRFMRPDEVALAIPNIQTQDAALELLSSPLPTNTGLACGAFNSTNCGQLSPDSIGVILNEDVYRIDLFVAPALLTQSSNVAEGYLRPTAQAPSFAYSIAGTFAGSESDTNYSVQNELIGSLGSARLRARGTVSSAYGAELEVGEVERDFDGWRARAGLLFVDGNEFIGRRRIIGAGLSSQIDTRADKEQIAGTPIPLVLNRPSRVEIYIDGRLASSDFYEPGSVLIRTTDLPNGSYPITLQIFEGANLLREESQFFSKDATIPPSGELSYGVYAGALRQFGSGISEPYYEAAISYRPTDVWVVDGSFVGTDKKALAQVGTSYFSEFANVRASLLTSTADDYGVRVQASSRVGGSISYNLDARRVWSSDDGSLLPLTYDLRQSDLTDNAFARVAFGSFTQIIGSLRYRYGNLGFGLTSYYRKADGFDASYAIGPSIDWNLLQERQLRLDVVADVQKTDSALASFMGLRFYTNWGAATVAGRSGIAHYDAKGRSPHGRLVGDVDASFSQATNWGNIYGSAGLFRELDWAAMRASTLVDHKLGSVRGEIIQGLENSRQSNTQYAVSLRSGAAYSDGSAFLSGEGSYQSGVAIKIEGNVRQEFEVLVDTIPRGRLFAGDYATIFLPPYQIYNIALRTVGGSSVQFDPSARPVTLFPGNVATMNWTAHRIVSYFGKLVDPLDEPLAARSLRTALGVAMTDQEGFFQIDSSPGDAVEVRAGDNACRFVLPEVNEDVEFYALEDVTCVME